MKSGEYNLSAITKLPLGLSDTVYQLYWHDQIKYFIGHKMYGAQSTIFGQYQGIISTNKKTNEIKTYDQLILLDMNVYKEESIIYEVTKHHSYSEHLLSGLKTSINRKPSEEVNPINFFKIIDELKRNKTEVNYVWTYLERDNKQSDFTPRFQL